MSYENPWTFDGEEFDSENIGNSYGFVYIITTPKGQKYVGRKYFWSVRKVKGKTRRQRSESDWKSYYGSSEVLKEEIKQSDKPLFKREIISLHSTKGRVNYEEVREQFAHEVLERDDYINDNINGKWHRSPEHIRSKSRFSALASRRTSKQDT
jgi:hypothetical protein